MNVYILFYRTLHLPDTEFNSTNIKNNDLSENSLLVTEESKAFLQQKNDNYELKPLGDITLKLEDIVPCTYLNIFIYI